MAPKASNHEIIATGEGYVSKQDCEKGIIDVIKYAPAATIKDLT
jgi:uncharacterized protein YegP (UPF0339 family)